jgi:phage terminase small subunit
MKKPSTPQKLTVRQERFCQNIAIGDEGTVAYLKAGWISSRDAARASASRLLTMDNIQTRIAELREKTEAASEFKRADLVRILVAVIQTPIGQISPDSPFVQEFSEDVITGGHRGKLKRGATTSSNETAEPVVIRRRVKSIGKIEAARLLVEIMGWKSPERVEVETGPRILDSIRERAATVASALDRNAYLRARGTSASKSAGLSRWNSGDSP